jgi:chromosome partitioning protein
MTKVLTLLSVKGGVGKTVTAVHLAGFLQQFGSTLLVDGDATRSATLWARPGNLPFKVVAERQIAMELSQNSYDYMVVDTEANPPDEDFNELVNSCHLVIVPATPDALGLQSAIQTSTKLRRAKQATPFKVLLTIVAPKPNRDGEEAMEYLQANGIPHFQTSIRRIVAFQRAVLGGTTVEKLDRSNLGWQDYVKVGENVLEYLGTPASKYSDTHVLSR